MKILKNIYDEILNSFPIPPPEQGGILGIKDGVICDYCHDSSCETIDCAVYEPDVDMLNQKIGEWENQGLQFAGIIHSHKAGQDRLSSGDKEYIKLLFDSLPDCIDKLYFPIIIPETRQVISFIVKRTSENLLIQHAELSIIS